MGLTYVRAQYETTAVGNETVDPTKSSKTLYLPVQTMKVGYGEDQMERDDEARYRNEPLPVLRDSFEPNWSLTQRAYPDTLGFLYKLGLGAPTTTAGDGIITDPDGDVIPTGAYRHVWTAPFGPTGINPQTAEFTLGYDDVFFELRGAALDEFTLDNQVTGGVKLDAKGPATFLDDISDPSLTPALESIGISPFRGGDLSVDWLSGASQLSREFSVKFVNPIAAIRTLAYRSDFPDTIEKADDLIMFSGEINARSLDLTDIQAMVEATGFAATARWISRTNIGATAYPYGLWNVFSNVQLTSYDIDELSNKRRHGGKIGFRASRDSSASTTITVVNATTSYA
jgi:hypothetical protein